MFRRKKRASQLAALLSDYPPYVPPVVKPLGALTDAEAEANLGDLLRVHLQRLARFGAFLSEFGIDLDAGLAAGNADGGHHSRVGDKGPDRGDRDPGPRGGDRPLISR